jgi:spore maturation protein CgeB
MRISLVWASASFSVRDVTTGFRGALLRAGHEVRDYRLDNRLELMARAFPDELRQQSELSRMATENVLAEATYHQADLVLVISGLLFHEVGLWLLQKYRIPTAVVLTESPYCDDVQQQWVEKYPDVAVFTQERTSAARHGWHYLPLAYDPEVHRPVDPDPDERCDVLFVGTGWPERQRLLEAVDWAGIDLKIRGLFPDMTDASPIAKYYLPGCVANRELPAAYAAAKIAINPYRQGEGAESLNPRAYELAACGVFQISDARAESADIFRDAIPTYRDAADLARIIRFYLAHPKLRQECAARALAAVKVHTFDQRVVDLMAVVAHNQLPMSLAAVG